ncbi:MAG: M23 family metallopeptidase, partial [Caldilineaceae bacterium]
RSDGEMAQARLQMPVFYPPQKTELDFPLRGAWWCIQAADWSDEHKRELYSQPYALDFVRLGANNGFFSGDGRTLEQHFAWNQPVYATAGGKVALVQADMPDMPPGVMPDPRMFRGDPRRLLGNAVAISHGTGEFSYFAHLRQAGVEVNEGQMVRRGALLGRVGNSGQSPGPHLHYHLMEGPHLLIDQGLPVRLRNFAAGGAWFAEPTVIPTRMIVFGPEAGIPDTDEETPA